MPVKILHVGVGLRGSHWLDFVDQHPDTVTAGCVDPDATALDRARGRVAAAECGFFSDLPEALDQCDADAVLIASPSRFHKDHAIAALQAGRTVMVEKPFSPSVADARAILDAAEHSGKQIVVAENYRYWPSERTLRKMILDGELGRVDNIVMVDRRHMPSHTEGPWLASVDYPQLTEIAIHHFDSLRAWLGTEPTSICVDVWNPPASDYKHGACSQAVIEFGDTRINYLGTLTSDQFGFSVVIEGEKGTLWSNRKYVLLRPAGKRLFWPVKRVQTAPGDDAKYPKGGTTSLLNSLRDAALEGSVAETSGHDNLWTVAMVEAGKLSHAENRRVNMHEVVAQ